jgi:hypothetical protein
MFLTHFRTRLAAAAVLLMAAVLAPRSAAAQPATALPASAPDFARSVRAVPRGGQLLVKGLALEGASAPEAQLNLTETYVWAPGAVFQVDGVDTPLPNRRYFRVRARTRPATAPLPHGLAWLTDQPSCTRPRTRPGRPNSPSPTPSQVVARRNLPTSQGGVGGDPASLAFLHMSMDDGSVGGMVFAASGAHGISKPSGWRSAGGLRTARANFDDPDLKAAIANWTCGARSPR